MVIDEKTITCCHAGCGIAFSVPAYWHKKRQDDHASFYCPNGHMQSFQSESGEEKMRRERDVAKQQLARAEQEAATAQRIAERAQKETKRLKKRVSAGTCPCCHRTVRQMALHMKTQHPDFIAETATVIPIKKAVRK